MPYRSRTVPQYPHPGIVISAHERWVHHIKPINPHLDWPEEQTVGTHINVTHWPRHLVYKSGQQRDWSKVDGSATALGRRSAQSRTPPRARHQRASQAISASAANSCRPPPVRGSSLHGDDTGATGAEKWFRSVAGPVAEPGRSLHGRRARDQRVFIASVDCLP